MQYDYFDTMQLITSPIAVLVTGMAASMGSICFGGDQRQTLLYPLMVPFTNLNPRKMVAAAVDINIQAQEMENSRVNILAKTRTTTVTIQQDQIVFLPMQKSHPVRIC